MKIVSVKNYKYGLINTLEPRSIPRGAASSVLNWQSMGDHIELRRGQRYLGTSSVNSGTGKATGLKKCTNASGVEVLFGTYGKKLKYYDEITEEWIENGSDILGAGVIDANGLGIEDIFMSEYVGLAGNQMYLNSPNCAGYYKIMVANPGSSVNLYDPAKNFNGNIRIDTNRTLLWGRVKDKTGVYGSHIDAQTYTTVAAESVGTGDGTTKHFIHNASIISGARTIFAVTVTAGAITLTDDFSGNLSASDGSTGTINYATGAITVDFAIAPVNLLAITTDYQWEDSNTSGITDFRKSGTRVAGEGFIFRQDEGGGAIMSVATYNQVYYCMHIKKTWVLSIGSDDTTATNLPYRQNVGIPNERASIETGDGIYYIDDVNKTDVRVRLLTYAIGGSNQVIPVPISKNLDLNDYRFDQAAAIEWGDLLLFACATNDSTQIINGKTVAVNNRVLVFSKLWKSWDILDYAVTCFEVYNGTLIGGDALANNFIELFSGWDDFDNTYPNYWIGNFDDLDIEGLKKSKKIVLQGGISLDQNIEVWAAADDSDFVLVETISGRESYVDKTHSIDIGAPVLGTKMIGGGGDGLDAYNYEHSFSLRFDKFERIKIKLVATGIGYASVSTQNWWDVRGKSQKVSRKYR